MATYIYDPSEQTTGIDPTGVGNGWSINRGTPTKSEIILKTTPVGAKAWELSGVANENLILILDAVGSVADCEVLLLVSRVVGTFTGFKAVTRCNATGNTMYRGGFRLSNSSTESTIRRELSGSASALSSTSYPYDNNYHWVRFRVEGTALKLRMWDSADAEPITWTEETTDSDIASGEVGARNYGTATQYLAWYSVGTGGDAAPLPGANAVLSNPSVSSITTTSIIPNVTLTF